MNKKGSSTSSRSGRPRRGFKKRVRTSFTLRPDDVVWLEKQALRRQQSKSEMLEICIALAQREFFDLHTFTSKLVEKYPSVYWDISPEDVHEEQHFSFIIERMLEHGTLNGIHDLLITFSRKRIAEVVIRSKRISRKTALFWKNFLGIKGSIHCLKKESQNLLSKPWE
jgi:hypothetical protein